MFLSRRQRRGGRLQRYREMVLGGMGKLYLYFEDFYLDEMDGNNLFFIGISSLQI